MITDKVKALRPLIAEYLAKGGYPWPVEFIMAIVQAESGGNVGEVNKKSGASGLLQIMPIALKQFNQDKGQKITMADMRSTDDRGARLQIEVGLHILGYMWRQAANYLKRRVDKLIFDDLAQFAQVFYVAGQGAAKKNIDQLSEPTFAALAARFSEWSAIPYTKRIWSDTIKQSPVWNLDAVDRWVGGSAGAEPGPTIAKTKKNGFLLGMLAIAVASFFLSKRS